MNDQEIMKELQFEIRSLQAEIRNRGRERDKVIDQFHKLRAVLEKIAISTSLKEAVAMAASILKQTALDHILPPAPLPAPPLKPKRRGPKTKDSKATLGDFL